MPILSNNTKILSNRNTSGTWRRPEDWLPMPVGITSSDQTFVGLHAIFENGDNYVSFRFTTSTGQYQVDWGDGTIELVNSNVAAEHQYDYSTYDTGNREQQLGSISRGLKATAKELNVPIISLAQLSRDVEKSNRLPMLSDLRESGSIEQDADIVMFLHNNTDPMEQIVDVSLVIAKHRAGQVGIIDYEFQKGFQRFVEKIKY